MLSGQMPFSDVVAAAVVPGAAVVAGAAMVVVVPAGAAVVVDDDEVDVLHLVVRREGEHDELDDRRDEHRADQGLVPEDLQKFLLQEEEHRSHASRILNFFRVIAR